MACGIGYCMLRALKFIYSNTFCILSMNGKYSHRFETKCGIRQGAPSSSWLFIVFIDDLIKFLRENCDPEPLLNRIHCLNNVFCLVKVRDHNSRAKI